MSMFFRRAMSIISGNAMLAGIAGSDVLRRNFTAPLPSVDEIAILGKQKRHGSTSHETRDRPKGWPGSTYQQPHGLREKERRVRQGAHFHQVDSHKLGTVRPQHIFASPIKDSQEVYR